MVPIATPKTLRLTLETIGIPAHFIPSNDVNRHPKSEPNKNGRGAPIFSRRRLNPKQIRTVLACRKRLECNVRLPCIHMYTINYVVHPEEFKQPTFKVREEYLNLLSEEDRPILDFLIKS